MIRTVLSAGALALTMGGLAAATPALAQRGDDIIVMHHHDGYGHDGFRRDGRFHRPPPPRCRTIIRERETRHGIERTRERICRGY